MDQPNSGMSWDFLISWYLLTSLGSRQWGPRELLRLFPNHWSVITEGPQLG